MGEVRLLPVRDPVSDPNRKELASAISLHAGAARDLIVAEQAAQAARSRYWNAEARLEGLRKEAPSGGNLSDDLIAAIAAGTCNVEVLNCSDAEARAKVAAAEREFLAWKAASEKCDLVVKERSVAVEGAKEELTRRARMVVCNSAMAARLMDDLETKQDEVIERRSALRFIFRHGLNGELPRDLVSRIENLMHQDLSGLNYTDTYRAWESVFEKLMEDPEAELPT